MRLKIHDDQAYLTFIAEQDIGGLPYQVRYVMTKFMLVDYLKPALLVTHIVNQLQRALNYEAKRNG